MRALFLILLFVGPMAGSISFAGQRIHRIEVAEPLKSQLLGVVSATEELRKAFVTIDRTKENKETYQLITAIDRALRVASGDPTHKLADRAQKLHVQRTLQSARTHLSHLLETEGKQRKQHLLESFRQLVIIVRNYELSDDYKIYFCARDKSFWVQKAGPNPQNPVNPESKKTRDCGRVMK